jgi:hypothetical protein
MQYCMGLWTGARMPAWQFLDYITEKNERPIITWYGTLEPNAKVEFDLLVKVLSETEDWESVKKKRQKFRDLERQHLGLTELVFEVEGKYMGSFKKKQFRPLGIRRKLERVFILLNGCEKHGFMGTVPPGAFEDAMRLKSDLEQGKGTTDAHPID